MSGLRLPIITWRSLVRVQTPQLIVRRPKGRFLIQVAGLSIISYTNGKCWVTFFIETFSSWIRLLALSSLEGFIILVQTHGRRSEREYMSSKLIMLPKQEYETGILTIMIINVNITIFCLYIKESYLKGRWIIEKTSLGTD